ncbi:MAG: hypothetical protein MUF04_10480, partial [Akkermansiaceae bacterium]|nr:hypothetical protein [Akkermansiaceae bacterium]
MKHLAILTALLSALCPAQEPEAPVILVPWKPAAREVPLFYSASATVRAVAGLEHVTTEQQLVFRIHQGRPERLSVALSAAGEVVAVHGEGLGDWAVRVAAGGGRFLDLRPVLPEDKDAAMPKEFAVTVQTKQPVTNGSALLCLPGQGSATGMDLNLTIAHDPAAAVRVVRAAGLVPVAGQEDLGFVGWGSAELELGVQPAGLAAAGIELTNTTLSGRLAPDGNSVAFTLTSAAKAATDNARIPLCGGVALASGVSGDGWHFALGNSPKGPVHELVAERAGDFALQAEFIVPVLRNGDRRYLPSFRFTGGVVVPVRLSGLPAAVEFDRSLTLVPEKAKDQPEWIGFLPAGGEVTMAWRATDAVSDGALFFSSTETTDIRVGSGLLRQMTVTDLRVLQGRLPALTYSLTGPGEILAVTGEGVFGWSVTGDADARKLQVRFSQPLTGTGRLVIESQAALNAFPVRAVALRATPDGSLRHSGWLRIANEGAVRIEPTDATGLIQLAPAQFPGGVDESLRQVFVYRFPSAEHSFAIQANQIAPEISVVEKTTYEIAEVDRRITSAIQLDIREAPVREWELEIPAGFAVAELSGAQVADYVLTGTATATAQRVRVGFSREVSGVQLINLRLEQNLAAKPGPWTLPKLQFPGAKSRRGLAGVVATAGYRVAIAKTTGVAELPLTSFGQQVDGLQQAFRLREENWDIHLNLEALGQSIQADVFHLYTLGSGVARGSVLINYFVVGAPAS